MKIYNCTFIYALLVLLNLELTSETKSLSYYNADKSKDMTTLKQMHNDVNAMKFSDVDALKQLETEAKSNGKQLMLKVFNEAYKTPHSYQKKCFKYGLSKAECFSVHMYTNNAFYNVFNKEISNGHWKKFKIFTNQLLNAINKLNINGKKIVGLTVYRGMNEAFAVPIAKRLYFKRFTSTSANIRKAQDFGTETFFHINITVNVLAAFISELSHFPNEEEILFSPFVALDLIKSSGSTMFFKTSSEQIFKVDSKLGGHAMPKFWKSRLHGRNSEAFRRSFHGLFHH